jgi:acetyl esterase
MSLDPMIQAMVDQSKAGGRSQSMAQGTVDEARQGYAMMRAIGGDDAPVASVVDRDAGGIPIRVYTPEGDGPFPICIYFHGGGFTIGSIETHDPVTRRLASEAGVIVVSVDYRLAPEHPFPAAVEDAIAAFRWACKHAAALGALPDKVAVGGDSAGGNLAAVVCQQTVAAGDAAPYAQILLYPPTDRTRTWASIELLGDGYFLTRADIDWYHLQYTGSTVAQPDPAKNPLCAKDFTGLAPALIVTAGFDPLRDEGEAYADALRQADVPVVRKRFDGLLHGFASMATISPACDAAVSEIVAALNPMISGAAARGF